MKIILESTTRIDDINGVPCRLWQGKTESGVPMHAYIALVAVDRAADSSEFERDLKEHAPPRVELGAIPLRFILD
jgi:hypothetical protein